MKGSRETSYDLGNDGDATAAGACSVRCIMI